MYEEKKSSINYRDLAIQLLFIVLFVLILLWIFPTKKSMKEYVEKNGGKNSTSENANNNKGNTTNNGNNNGNSNGSGNQGQTEKTYLYEYAKTNKGGYGAWSEWSTNVVYETDTIDVETSVRNVQTGTKTTSVLVGKTTEKYLIGYVTNKGALVGYDEEYLKTESGPSVPKDTEQYKYKQIATVTQNGQTTYTYNVYKLVPKYEEKVSEVYGEREVPQYETKSEPVYGNVTYYRYREMTTSGVDVKWSEKENDEELISAGYQFTGNVKEK